MPPIALGRRRFLAVAGAAAAAGCTVAHRTDLMRQDELTDAQQVVADARISHGELTVEVSVDRADTTYDPGQPIKLTVKTNKDANVAILRVLANGDTALVFPNRAQRSAAVAANAPLTVPGSGGAVNIAVDKPGIVLFEVVASMVGTSWLFTRAPDEGSDFANLGASTRNLAKDLVSTLKVGGSADTAAAHLTVRITGRSLL